MVTEPNINRPTLVIDPAVSARLIAQRRARGADHHDEVWKGVYVMTPLPNNEHQEFVAQFTAILVEVVDRENSGATYPGVNLSGGQSNWKEDYRCPDVVVFLRGNSAQDCGTHWTGGPDFVIEIASPYDRTREKVDFYEKIGVRELLIIDRDPWQFELLKLNGAKLTSAGVSTLEHPAPLLSESTLLSFRLAPGDERPTIAIVHSRDQCAWTA
jgi:Uma2 family endonuclease